MNGLAIANPLFLWLLPLAALPVLFHLFFRIRKRSRPFSTFMFFYRADPRLSARKRIREWLTLLLRALVIAFLLLALARLLWLGRGRTGNVAIAMVLDNSGSMSDVSRDGRTKLSEVREAAEALVSTLSGNDAAAVVLLVDDPRITLPPGLTSDAAVLRSCLQGIGGTEASGSPGRALENAFDILAAASCPLREIHIFTDLQETEWGRALSVSRPPPAGTTIHVHRIPSDAGKRANVSVVEAAVPPRRLLAGRRIAAKISLLNTTAIEAKVRVNAVSDEGARSTQDIAVPAREVRAVTVPVQPAAPGFHWLDVWVEGDAFQADNRAGLGFVCGEKERVLLAGAEAEFGALPIALSPSGDGAHSGLVPVFAAPAALPRALSEHRPAMVVTTWDALPEMGADRSDGGTLRKYVEDGGILLVLPAAAVPATVKTADWIGGALKEEARSDAGLPLLVFDKGSALWHDLRDEKGDVLVRNVRVFRSWTLSPSPGAVPLLGLEDGRAVMTVKSAGRGMIFAAGFALDPRWSTLPLRSSFVPIVQSMALLKPDASADVVSLVAGEKLPLPASRDRTIHLHSLAGGPLDWKGPAGKMPAIPKSGVYAVEFAGGTRYAAVRSSDREGQARFVEGSAVPALGGFSHEVTSYTGRQAFLKELKKGRTGLDMYLPLILLALLAALAEGWLVNPRVRKAVTPADAPRAPGRPAGSPGLAAIGALVWHPHVSAVQGAVLFGLVAVWLYFVHQRMLTRLSPSKARALIVAKAASLVLLLLALFDPSWSMPQRRGAESRILALVDESSSMDVKDDAQSPRIARARRALDRLKDRLGSQARVETRAFDTEIRDFQARPLTQTTNELRGTDLAGCLLSLSERSDTSAYSAIAIFTDGGDETVEGAALPPVPLYVAGIGSDPSRWNDLAIGELRFPAAVEKDVGFEISADLTARAGGGGNFAANLAQVRVSLERKRDASWEPVAENTVNLSNRRARTRFRASCAVPGIATFRVSVQPVAGELSLLNNTRTFQMDVRKKAVHVLFFTREVGSDLKTLRNELASDPGVTFTALYRTIGERFTVQGERLPGDEDLDAGFPTSPDVLKLFDCVVIGSFPSSQWRKEQMEALAKYVSDGGAAIFLGGEESFGRGGYAGTPLAPLFPWQVKDGEPEMLRGEFSVSIPAAASADPIVSGIGEHLSREGKPLVESLNVARAAEVRSDGPHECDPGRQAGPAGGESAFRPGPDPGRRLQHVVEMGASVGGRPRGLWTVLAPSRPQPLRKGRRRAADDREVGSGFLPSGPESDGGNPPGGGKPPAEPAAVGDAGVRRREPAAAGGRDPGATERVRRPDGVSAPRHLRVPHHGAGRRHSGRKLREASSGRAAARRRDPAGDQRRLPGRSGGEDRRHVRARRRPGWADRESVQPLVAAEHRVGDLADSRPALVRSALPGGAAGGVGDAEEMESLLTV